MTVYSSGDQKGLTNIMTEQLLQLPIGQNNRQDRQLRQITTPLRQITMVSKKIQTNVPTSLLFTRQMFPRQYCSQACVKRVQKRTKHILQIQMFPSHYYSRACVKRVQTRTKQIFKVTDVHQHAYLDRFPDRLLFIKLLLFKILQDSTDRLT